MCYNLILYAIFMSAESFPFKVKVIEKDKVYWFFSVQEEPQPMFNPDIASILKQKNLAIFTTDPVEIPCLGQLVVDFTKNEVSGVLLAYSGMSLFLDSIKSSYKNKIKSFFECGMLSELTLRTYGENENRKINWENMHKNEDVSLFLENSLDLEIISASSSYFNLIPSDWKQDLLYPGFHTPHQNLKDFLRSMSESSRDEMYEWFLKTKPIIENGWGNSTIAITSVHNIFNEEVIRKKLKSSLKPNGSVVIPRF